MVKAAVYDTYVAVPVTYGVRPEHYIVWHEMYRIVYKAIADVYWCYPCFAVSHDLACQFDGIQRAVQSEIAIGLCVDFVHKRSAKLSRNSILVSSAFMPRSMRLLAGET